MNYTLVLYFGDNIVIRGEKEKTLCHRLFLTFVANVAVELISRSAIAKHED